MYQLLALIVLLLSLWLYSRWRWMQLYWMKKGVPQCPLHPILGSLTFLQKCNPGVWMRELYNEYKSSPYVGIWVFWRPGLVVNCPNIARNILIKDAEVFRNRLLSSGKTDPIGGLNLFTVNDPLWSSLRKQINPIFTSAKLRALQELYHRKAVELVDRIKADIKKGITIDLRATFVDYTTDVIGEAAFGIVSNATLTGNSALKEVTKEFMKYDAWRGLAWSSIFFFPELVDIFRFTFFPKKTTDYFKKIFKAAITLRGGYDNENKGSRDLLDVLLKIKQNATKQNESLNEDVLIAQAAIVLQAGYDTSSLAISYAIYELAFNPQCQIAFLSVTKLIADVTIVIPKEKLFEELSQAKKMLGDKEFDSSILAELTYLNGVINETLRKYPVMGWLDRIAEKDYNIDGKLVINAGTVVYVNANGLHMDPQYFPEPENFNPDRFSLGNEKDIQPFTFMPFGEGPRHCIGKRFGLNTVRFALALIMLAFEVHPLPGTPKPSDCKVEKRGLFYMPDEPLYVKFISRK